MVHWCVAVEVAVEGLERLMYQGKDSEGVRMDLEARGWHVDRVDNFGVFDLRAMWPLKLSGNAGALK